MTMQKRRGKEAGLMTVELSTHLLSPPERVWQEVRKPALLDYVAAPLMRFERIEPKHLPETWGHGRFLVSMRLFGIIPLGRQWIVTSVEREDTMPGHQHYQLRDNGRGQLIRVWDHWIFIEACRAGGTRYTDRVAVEAGLFTPFVWVFARLFYAHRQRRWQRLVARDYRYG